MSEILLDPPSLEQRQIDPTTFDRSVELYLQFNKEGRSGPQREGIIDAESVGNALRDPNSVCVRLFLDSSGVEYLYPIFAPIKHNGEYRADYFEPEFPGRVVYYFSPLPKNAFLSEEEGVDFEQDILDLAQKNPIIVFEESEEELIGTTQIDTLCARLGLDLKEYFFIDPRYEGSLASVLHYSTPAIRLPDVKQYETIQDAASDPNDELLQYYYSKGITYVNGAQLTDEIVEELWGVYSVFDEVLRYHPSSQKMPWAQFDAALRSEKNHILYTSDEKGISSFVQIIEGLENCPWINAEYYETKYGKHNGVFYPAIATRPDVRGISNAPKLIALMCELTARVGTIDRAYTQCTNITANYIPPAIERFSRKSAVVKLEQTGVYNYKAYMLNEVDEA